MRSVSLLLAPCLFASLAACFAAPDEGTGSTSDEVAETDDILGDDRVADVLRGHFERIPKSYAESEQLFGVGRACARTDAKEIFVVEESQTRDHGQIEKTDRLLPRTVVTGCNTPEHALAETTDPQSGSFGLFIALFSDDSISSGDPMITDRVEAMALDRRTGLYNFYVFEGGRMERVRLTPNDEVRTWTLAPGASRSTSAKTPDRACNNCHVNMGPLLNELHEPWTNWVSTRKTLPLESNFTGETASIVKNPSFANDLQKTIEAGIRVWNEGLPGVPGSGFVQQNLDGNQPRGAAGLLKSVFCETELQYDSAFEVTPLALFVDPGAVAGAGLLPPSATSLGGFPLLFPVRSEMDKRIEAALVKKRQLTMPTVLATRLFDEENDVFSKSRCDLFDDVRALATPDDASIRSVLRTRLDRIPAGPRHDYAKALLTDGADASTARAAYLADLAPRFAAMTAKLDSAGGLAQLEARSNARKDSAERLFPGERAPLPLLPRD